MTINELLKLSIDTLTKNKIENPILQSRILLAYTLNKEKEYLIVNKEEQVSKKSEEEYRKNIEKLSLGTPIQYITNKQEFMKLDFYVDEHVLIPRPDTEILVEEVIDICNRTKTKSILDLCTGSGAIAISVAKYVENINIYASDINKDALEIVNINAKNNNVQITTILSNIFEDIKNMKFDVIVSNPPYIKTDVIKTLEKQVQKEPKIALDGGKEGLDFYITIINEAHKYLNNDGYLCLEIGYDQREDVIDLINKTNKYTNIYAKKDLAGNDRIIIVQKINQTLNI